MSDTKHTPENWTWEHHTNREEDDKPVGRNIGIRGTDGGFIALIEGDVYSMEQQEAAADLIIRSVNHYTALLEALDNMIKWAHRSIELEVSGSMKLAAETQVKSACEALATARA